MATTYIKHRGFFSFQDVISTIYNFLTDNYYDTIKFPTYKFKIPSPAGAEYEIEINAEKKVTEYFRYELKIWLKVYDMRDVEIVKEGRKIQTNDGKIQVEITPELIRGWQGTFKGKGFWDRFAQWLKNFYEEYIIKYKIVDYWEDMALIEAGRLAKEVQAVLGQEVV